MSEVTDDILDDVVDITYEVGRQASQHLIRVASMTGVGGLLIGGGLGYFLARRLLENKSNAQVEAAVTEMQEYYREKVVALDAAVKKVNLEDLVKEKGYVTESTEPPMVITPPTAVIEAAEAAKDEEPLMVVPAEAVEDIPPPVEEEVRNVFKDRDKLAPPEDGWDYHRELRNRSPIRPYVIHIDEKNERDTYAESTLTYYEEDDVLCDEKDDIIDSADRDRLIGEKNLEKFGHGSGDPSIVYIRNDALGIVYEVVLSPNSFAEEVHGLKHSDEPRRRRRDIFDDE